MTGITNHVLTRGLLSGLHYPIQQVNIHSASDDDLVDGNEQELDEETDESHYDESNGSLAADLQIL